ncbi:MAG TPA: GAF domain-containing protein [Gemmatimonadales bacterium]
MAEETLDLRALPKKEAYETLQAHCDAVLAGIDDEVTEMATLACLLHNAFGHLWTGFYRVVEPGRLLRVGPYQGTLGCLEIGFGKGVCGTAAAERRTVVVEDVNAFPGHITCDARSRSEIVVPVFGRSGELIAVLDIDSDRTAAFDDVDRVALERLVGRMRGAAGSTPVTGYSDRINHALAFAAKHHDRQVRKGLRLPYFTAPANVAIILTRYGLDDEVVIAGILHDLVEDCVREGREGDGMLERVGYKFGEGVLGMLRSVTLRRHDDDGVELSAEERREDLLARLARTGERERWIIAADELHDCATLLADLARTDFPEVVWDRVGAGREGTIRWYRQLHDRLREVGFAAPIMAELGEVVTRLEGYREA